jgi:hypothetical protein
MGDQQSMFVILAVFYALECLLWLPRGCVAFMVTIGDRFRLRYPRDFLGNHRGAFVVKPLLPLGTTHCAAPMPIALAPEGIVYELVANVHAGESPVTTGRCLQWSELKSIKAKGKAVVINGLRWWKTPAAPIAARQAKELRALRDTDEADRSAAIESWLADGFDSHALAEVTADVKGQGRVIGILGSILFVFVNLGLLPLAFMFAFTPLWGWIIGLALLQTTTITHLFHRAHSRLYPDAGDERFTAALTMLLFAPAAMRAKDGLVLPAFSRFHPLTVAAAVMPAVTGRHYAAFLLRELRHAQRPAAPGIARQISDWYRERLTSGIEKFCESNSWPTDELLRPPERSDPDSQTYCPRCHSEFVVKQGTCLSCGGVGLLNFEAKVE